MTPKPILRRSVWLCLGPLFALMPLPAQERIKWSRIEKLMQQFDAISPPPPPVEVVAVGNLDVSTGTFTWAPGIGRKPTNEENPAFAVAFDRLRLPAMVIDLAPGVEITGLAPRFRPAAGAARPRPAGGKEAGQAGGDVIAKVPPIYTGGSMGMWKYFAPVRAGKVDLVFTVSNRPAGAKLSITCEKRTVELDADSVDILAPPRVTVAFSLQCGGKEFTDRLWFDRPPVLGYFMLEALPVTVVYEPPGSGSSQSYSVIEQIGTTVRSFASKTSSESAPVDTAFSTVHDLIELVGTVGSAVAKVKPEVGAAMQGASSALTAAIGDQEVESEVTTTVTAEHTISMQVKEGTTVSTNAHLGPGRGDMLWYLYHPVFAWLAVQDETSGHVYLTVSLLGYRRVSRVSAEGLRQGAVPEPNAAMRNLLLAYDVMTAEHAAAKAAARGGLRTAGSRVGIPGAGRLVAAEPFEQEFEGGNVHYEFERKLATEDVETRTTTETMTTTGTSGFLSFVSDNLPQDGTTTMSVSQGTSKGTRKERTIKASVTLGAQVGEAHLVHCWYDRLTGTFAYEEVAYGASSNAISGGVTGSDGAPAAGQPVTLRTAGGVATRVVTDAQGRFKIRSPLLQKGQHLLEVAGERFPLAFEPGVTAAQALRLRGAGPAVDPGPAFGTAPGAGLKGRMGRLVVEFPKAAPAKQTIVELFDPAAGAAGEKGRIETFYGSKSTDLLAGEYAVEVSGQRVAGVRIERGQQTTLHVGTLRVHAGKGTSLEILPASGDRALVQGYGAFETGLPVGRYRVRVHGRTAEVIVTAGAVTEF